MVTLWWLSTENLSRDAVDVTAVLDVIRDTVPEWVQGGFASRLGLRILIGMLNVAQRLPRGGHREHGPLVRADLAERGLDQAHFDALAEG